MRWHCQCGAALIFISRRCPHCRRPAAYIPELDFMRTLSPGEPHCANRMHGCNWTAEQPNTLCFSCRLTRVIPPQDTPENRSARRRFDRAKRHLTASLIRLKLLPRYARGPHGNLEINLLQDRRDNAAVAEEFVYTGHLNGIISINAREANPLIVETTRLQMNEKYRTLLGSLRHETGHYFWQVLVAADDSRLRQFRELFGDERADYQEAMQKYYSEKPGEHPSYVSEYARMHPHEDWAETWAHYMHMENAIAAAAGAGMIFARGGDDFSGLLPRWRQVAEIANALSTALGHRPSYPFYSTHETMPKLHFIHDLLLEEKNTANQNTPPEPDFTGAL